MTRETKVGLLVGMGVILLIGIIISDHLSQVNDQRPAAESMTGFAERAQESINSLVEPAPEPAATPMARRDGSVLQRVQPVPTPREMERPRWEQTAQPPQAQPGMPELPRAYNVDQSRVTAREEASPMGQPMSAATHPGRAAFVAGDVPTLTLSHETPERTRLASAEGSPMAFDATAMAPVTSEHTDAALAAATREAAAPQPSGTEFIHYVKEGETLYAIAEKFYGSGDYWKSIAQYNPGKVMANGQVRPNVRLVIPNLAGLAQLGPDFVPVGGDAPGRIRLAQGEAPSGPGAPVKAERTIEVEEGDTLTKLASEHLGSAGAWRKLLDANRGRLSRPEDLRAGMKLVLPTDETQATTAATQAAAPVTRETAARSAKPQAASGAGEYTIEEGDTLYKIASKTLGDGKRWQELFNANKDRLKDPDTVTVGMKLRIPR